VPPKKKKNKDCIYIISGKNMTDIGRNIEEMHLHWGERRKKRGKEKEKTMDFL
jgi:hypothetical protein